MVASGLSHVPGARRERVERCEHGGSRTADSQLNLPEQFVVGERCDTVRAAPASTAREAMRVSERPTGKLVRQTLGEDPDEERGSHGSGGGHPARDRDAWSDARVPRSVRPGRQSREPDGPDDRRCCRMRACCRARRSAGNNSSASSITRAVTSPSVEAERDASALASLARRADAARSSGANVDPPDKSRSIDRRRGERGSYRRPFPIDLRLDDAGLRAGPLEQLPELPNRAEEMHAHGGLAQAQAPD